MASNTLSSNVYISKRGKYPHVQPVNDLSRLILDTTSYFNPRAYTFKNQEKQPKETLKIPHFGNNNNNKTAKTDPLTRRLTRMVTELQNEENRDSTNIPGLKFVNGKDENILLRLLWVVIIILNVGMCSFQIYDRISYYISTPVATDFRIIMADEWPAPSITMCSTETDLAIKARSEFKLLESNTPNLVECAAQLMRLLDVKNLTFETKWNAFNTSQLIRYADIRRQTMQDETTLPKLTTEIGNTIYGVCVTFRSTKPLPVAKAEMRVGLDIAKNSCASGIITGTTQAGHESANYMNSFMFGIGINVKLELEVKMYQFVNIPREPCVTEDEFTECRMKCILKHYKKNVICSFPFVDANATGLSPCENEMPDKAQLNMSDVYGEAMNSFLNVDLSKCGCYRACSQNEFLWSSTEYEFFNNNTSIFVKFTPHGFPWIVQRLPYDFTSLLCDIGGNLGLYLGWSVLSIFEFMQLTKRNAEIRPQFNASNDPLYRKVCKVHKQVVKEAAVKNTRRLDVTFKRLLHMIVTLLCLAFFIYQIQDRTRYYFAYPFVSNVEIEERVNVTFPLITICGWSMKTRADRKFVAKNSNIPEEEMIIFDLFQADKPMKNANPLQLIWSRSDNSKEAITSKALMSSADMLKSLGKYKDSLLIEESTEMVNLPHGLCLKLKIGTHMHKGSNTVHSTLWSVKQLIETETRQVYINPEEEEIDFTNPVLYPTNVSMLCSYAIQETRRWNSPNSHCVSAEELIECKKRCIERLLLPTLPCNLPYMQNNTLKNCGNKEESVHANKLYLKFLSRPIPPECECHPQCRKIIYRVSETALVPGNIKFDVLLNGFSTNIVEMYVESSAYSTIKYLCDVGSNLGLALGYSILHVFQLLTTFGKSTILRFSSL